MYQIIKNPVKQIVGVINDYCSAGFAKNAKYYMSDSYKRATDTVATKKYLQHTSNNVRDYFNQEFVTQLLKDDIKIHHAYSKLCSIDDDGLFLPILINEIDKYGSSKYPSNPCTNDSIIITKFIDFILNIAQKKKDEIVETLFNAETINIRIILAISDFTYNIKKQLEIIKKDTQSGKVNTIYILASSKKIRYAKEIADSAYKEHPTELCISNKSEYKRHSHGIEKDSICYELNVIR